MNLLKCSKLDIKSFAIGFLLSVTIALLLASSNSDGDSGRYRCCESSGDPLAVFVVDSFTGHTWRLDRAGTIDYGMPYKRASLRTSITPKVD